MEIWRLDTGILDLTDADADLAASELVSIRDIWAEQQARLKGTKQLSEFSEKLSREWAIETGIIENLYEIDRGVTLVLIERGFQAELIGYADTNKPRDYVIELLRDQKDALDGVFDFVARRRQLSTSYIKELHAALLRSQSETEGVDPLNRRTHVPLLKGAWKVQSNYPTRDGHTYTHCPPEHVASQMDELIRLHLSHSQRGFAPEVQAAWLHHRFTQIHPFQDGNGRVARALASLVLVQSGLFPLVITRDDKSEYIDSLESADQDNLDALIKLFARLQRSQFRKATAISENILAAKSDVNDVLGGLLDAAERVSEDRRTSFKKVFALAKLLENDVGTRLEEIAPSVKTALQRVTPGAGCHVSRSDESNDHWFRAQIFRNAKYHLSYFADTSEYREWISLNMFWKRRARFVFAFHGIGRPFSGSLVCAPFLEFRDTEEDQSSETFIPLAEEAFVFFYNEDFKNSLQRFFPWRERVLTVALRELGQNL